MSMAAELPTVIKDPAPPPAAEPKRRKAEAAKAEPASPPQIQNDVSVTVPMSHVGDGYIPRDVYARGLTSKQSTNLKRLMRGLEDRGARLENGAPVNDRTKAVKWLLEQLG